MSSAEADDQPYRGAELSGTYAAVSSGVRPRFFRYARYEIGLRFLSRCTAILFGIGLVIIRGGSLLRTHFGGWTPAIGIVLYVIGALLVLLGAVIGLCTIAYYLHSANYFENALLTPGVVLSRDPLAVVVLASMSDGRGPEYHGIARLDLKDLPDHDHEPGTRVPCVSRFAAKEGLDRWAYFVPEPVSFGTGDAKDLSQCFERLGEEPFRQLERCVRRAPMPKDADEIVLLDANLNYLETLEKSTALADS